MKILTNTNFSYAQLTALSSWGQPWMRLTSNWLSFILGSLTAQRWLIGSSLTSLIWRLRKRSRLTTWRSFSWDMKPLWFHRRRRICRILPAWYRLQPICLRAFKNRWVDVADSSARRPLFLEDQTKPNTYSTINLKDVRCLFRDRTVTKSIACSSLALKRKKSEFTQMKSYSSRQMKFLRILNTAQLIDQRFN